MSTPTKRSFGRAPRAESLVALLWGISLLAFGAACTDRGGGPCAAVVGSYVTAFSDREEVFSSRGLMTFTSDGTLLVSDSAQGGVPGLWEPFSTAQGTWKCLGEESRKVRVSAVALNFVLPADGRTPFFGRVDYKADLDTRTGQLEGSAKLSFTSGQDLEGANPVDGPIAAVDEFHFTGKRLAVKE